MENNSQNPAEEVILLFDGVCNLCNGFVQFILKRDPKKVFRFASLQSGAGQELLKRHNLPTDTISTVVLVENGKAYTHSTAALRVARRLSGGWALFYAFIILPRPLRDLVYRFIAKNRYKWFGQQDACMIPTPELKARFLT